MEEVDLAVAADALKPRAFYEHFDDLSLEVMKKNNALLMREALATVAIADRPKAVLFFDVRNLVGSMLWESYLVFGFTITLSWYWFPR